MGSSDKQATNKRVNVNMATGQAVTGHRECGGQQVDPCKICGIPRHVCIIMSHATASHSWNAKGYASDHWFMSTCMPVQKNASTKECQYTNCKFKHENPTKEPEEDPTPVKCNTLGTLAKPTEIRAQDLTARRDAGSVMPINM